MRQASPHKDPEALNFRAEGSTASGSEVENLERIVFDIGLMDGVHDLVCCLYAGNTMTGADRCLIQIHHLQGGDAACKDPSHVHSWQYRERSRRSRLGDDFDEMLTTEKR